MIWITIKYRRKGIYKFVNILYNKYKCLRKDTTMTTKREYLASKGITVGKRGRFSAAAKRALAEADKNGVKFTAETSVKTPSK